MNHQYSKITALYSRLSVGDEDRDGGESNSIPQGHPVMHAPGGSSAQFELQIARQGIQNQKIFLERYAKQQKLTNIKHYIDDDESGRFFDRSAYVQMMDDVENGKVGIVIMRDMTRW